jgi:hypothetical protein
MEAIIDYDLGISYTPGKANVMANAFSYKSYCCELEVQLQQPLLYEELRKLNIKIVPQGYINTLVVEPDLEQNIKTRQKYDSEVEKIKSYLSKGNSSCLVLQRPHSGPQKAKSGLALGCHERST